MRHLPTLILAAVALACTEAEPTSGPLLDAASGVEHASGDAARVYEVTIENLTTGQPFSPGIIVTHTAQQSLFAVGTEASEGLRLIAENGDPSMAVSMLAGAAGLADFQVVDAPIHRRGGPGPSTYTLTIEAKANANRLSGALMLICTNDGFVGLDRGLPDRDALGHGLRCRHGGERRGVGIHRRSVLRHWPDRR